MVHERWKHDSGKWFSDSDGAASQRRRERRSFAESINEKLQSSLDCQAQFWCRLSSIESTLAMLSASIQSMPRQSAHLQYVEVPKIVQVEVPKVQFVEVPKYVNAEVLMQKERHDEHVGVARGEKHKPGDVDALNGNVSEQLHLSSLCGRWEALASRVLRIHVHQVASDGKEKYKRYLAEERIAHATGEERWSRACALRVGDVVRVLKRFQTADESVQVPLPVGCSGVVDSIDGDGDALISFPSLTCVKSCVRWVVKSCFKNLSVNNKQDFASAVEMPLKLDQVATSDVDCDTQSK